MTIKALLVPVVVSALTSTALAGPRVIITEIMYNPASDEKKGESEWVEIANVGDEAIEINGWRLDDEGRDDWAPFSCSLSAGGVVVLVNAAAVNDAEFRAAWDAEASSAGNPATYQVIAVKWGSLANQASTEKEILQLVDDAGKVVCEVNYESSGDWPGLTMAGGPSIWLTDIKATSLSQGSLWKASREGQAGARRCAVTKVFNGPDVGSPGHVDGLVGDPKTRPPAGDKPGQTPSHQPPKPGGDKGDDKVPF